MFETFILLPHINLYFLFFFNKDDILKMKKKYKKWGTIPRPI